MDTIPTPQPVAQSTIDLMRENVSRLQEIALREWPQRDALRDTDRLSFLDGQKACVQFGGDKRGDGAIWFDDDEGCWVAKIQRDTKLVHCDCDETAFKTFRDALDCFMEEYARLMA